MRVSHEQNLVLPHVRLDDLPRGLRRAAARRARHGQCRARHRHHRLPGPRLLRARQCPLDPHRPAHLRALRATRSARREIGELKIKISGCINACGHHHVGHIGILGVERKGEEFYQITLGGSGDETCSIGEIVGQGFSSDEIVDAVETVVDTYLALRHESARRRSSRRSGGCGEVPFRDALYPAEAA